MGNFRDRLGNVAPSGIQTSKTTSDKNDSQGKKSNDGNKSITTKTKGVTSNVTSISFDRMDKNLLEWAVREWITRYRKKKGPQTKKNVDMMKDLLEKVKKL